MNDIAGRISQECFSLRKPERMLESARLVEVDRESFIDLEYTGIESGTYDQFFRRNTFSQ